MQELNKTQIANVSGAYDGCRCYQPDSLFYMDNVIMECIMRCCIRYQSQSYMVFESNNRGRNSTGGCTHYHGPWEEETLTDSDMEDEPMVSIADMSMVA